jgi:serine/threonine-protein kinase
MRVCPRCHARYPKSERFCSADSTVLVEDADIRRIGTTIGNYHLAEILGRGGMGTVYSGEHVYIGKKVAVKILHPQFAKYDEAVSRFLREARAATAINHPNIVDVTDFGPTPDGAVYFVMEYLEGTSLEDLIESHGAIPLHRALNIANQMALGLAAAHKTGIIHRDLKPDNIMLIRMPGRRDLVRAMAAEDGSHLGYVIERESDYDFVKLLDFGIAKVLNRDGLSSGDTLQGAVFGTPEYMSPEAARGEEVDHRADIYSLGVILFDMLTGHPPFEASAAAEVLAMQINATPPSPRDRAPHLEITEATENLVLRAMAKSPDERYQSMDELREELQHCYGTISFKRNARLPGVAPVGREARSKRLTEELHEWMHSDQRQLTLEEAKILALMEPPDSPPAPRRTALRPDSDKS